MNTKRGQFSAAKVIVAGLALGLITAALFVGGVDALNGNWAVLVILILTAAAVLVWNVGR